MIFHELSKECYDWLNEQPNVKEESLTDWLLYQSNMRSNKIFYKSFTRNEESHIGADWEWWILTEDRYGLSAYRLLVQAKKLKKKEDNYKAITYGNKNGMQIDLLLSSAFKRQALPLYAYYICSHPDIKEQLNNFSFIDEHIIRWCEKCTNGVYLSSATSIRKRVIEQPKRKITEKELLDNSLGLSLLDLLFNGNSESKNNPLNFLDILNKRYFDLYRINMQEMNNYNTEYSEHRGFKYSYKQFPRYLTTIIQRQGKDIDWLEKEFQRELKDLSGVVVIYANNKS